MCLENPLSQWYYMVCAFSCFASLLSLTCFYSFAIIFCKKVCSGSVWQYRFVCIEDDNDGGAKIMVWVWLWLQFWWIGDSVWWTSDNGSFDSTCWTCWCDALTMSCAFILAWTVCNHSAIVVFRAPGKSWLLLCSLLHLLCVHYSGSSRLLGSPNCVASELLLLNLLLLQTTLCVSH